MLTISREAVVEGKVDDKPDSGVMGNNQAPSDDKPDTGVMVNNHAPSDIELMDKS
jgi:hypothetical protein